MREIVFELSTDQPDLISDQLMTLGALSVSVEDAQADSDLEQPIFGEPGTPSDLQAWPASKIAVLIHAESDRDAHDFWREVCTELPECAAAIVEIREITDRDWVSETQRQFSPFSIADRLWVGPHWGDPPSSFTDPTRIIRIDPGMAFGTGSHATTQLCLEMLVAAEQKLTRHPKVLDMGCGSGILAIAAARLGATDVTAVDIDPIAVQTTIQNAMANQVQIRAVDAETAIAGPFDIVMANILAQPLKVLAPAISRHVRPNGMLLLSGILARQADEILNVYRPLTTHLTPMRVLAERDGWVCIGTLPSE